MIHDPTYDKKEIERRLDWKLAFLLSELANDDAPMGWSRYIPIAQRALKDAQELPKHEPADGKFCPNCGYRHPPDGICV